MAVLGAGCAGLAAARALLDLGLPVVILEAASRPGGLAGGVSFGDNIYEYGPHMFHTGDPQIMAHVQGLAGDALIEYQRTIKIKFADAFFNFPLAITDVITKLPLATVAKAGLSWAWHSLLLGRFGRPAQENSETVLRRSYGQVLYEIFFKSYIERVWGLSPAAFSPAFARQRIPKMQIMELLEGVLRRVKGRQVKQVRPDDFVETLDGTFYSTRRGFSLITDRLARDVTSRGGDLRLEARVLGLERQDRRVTQVRYQQDGQERSLACAGVVSTLPVNQLLLGLEPAPPEEVKQAAESLRFRPTVFVGLLVKRPKVLPASFMYFREHSFNRISDLAQFGIEVRPAGHTMLVAEITCEEEDRPWSDDGFALASVLKELEAEGLLRAEEVAEAHVYRSREAYPVYLLGYEEQLGRCLDYVESMANLETAGRQGRFQYVNAHVALKMGMQAAQRLAQDPGLKAS